MHQPQWIWYPGDYEIHHALKLNCRREERDLMRPAFWRLDDCWHNVSFRLKTVLNEAESVTVHTNGIGNVTIDGKAYAFDRPVKLEAGEHTLQIRLAKTDGLPSAYVTGTTIYSGSHWQADNMTNNWLCAGTSLAYQSPNDDPEVFPFQYEDIAPVATEAINGGTLYDFGRETFACLCFEDISAGPEVMVYYGESREEALSCEGAMIRDALIENETARDMPPRAFRYIYIPQHERSFKLKAKYEYLPLDYKGSFASSDDTLNKIWQTAAYTFHLNSREFFLDGIKRDRWVWSGDAYQSYLINYYLFFDEDIVRRTSTALRGKDPVEQHINNILDYSLYWVIALGDYYRYTGDEAYIRFIWPRAKTMLDFCLSSLNEDGFIFGGETVWTFIDWHKPLDKTGAVCAEQMLLAKALEVAGRMAEIAGAQGDGYLTQAEKLRKAIDTFYWDDEKHAYIDSYASGTRNVTRHANIFAILFGIAGEDKKRAILEHVLENDAVPPITTPYFKFYELEAMCAFGSKEGAYQRMADYWGGMLRLGATSIWEEYDPAATGLAHLGMYGDAFDKSLCHAWGASPIYLLGRYFLGIYPTSDGYETFVCQPDPGGLEWMEGTVPIKGGKVHVSYRDKVLCVTANRAGGVVRWGKEEVPLVPGKTLVLK